MKFLDLVNENRKRNQEIRLQRQKDYASKRKIALAAGIVAVGLVALNKYEIKDD